jgi:hypothetical protein
MREFLVHCDEDVVYHLGGVLWKISLVHLAAIVKQFLDVEVQRTSSVGVGF